ncbi:hypothetical protein BDV28DRAFT_127734 [Aspergillus coremiiformis]|uniref:NAD binding Rossmann fold oxidoreductase n=1 Tax=Aspergillus coremiiformis TaxID=138285 RepID=A0A5N6ZJ10_9EURO|nr:hypothetical protein BDV28DRAFT_127734 [Aspergillus coremiiformis]
MPAKTWNVCVIGYGLSAKTFHLPFIQLEPRLKLYAIYQRDVFPNDDAAVDYPDLKVYRSSEEMFKDEAIDVVVVSTSPESHYPLIKLALEHGKHVVSEKPFTPTTQEADELIALSKKQNKLLAVYQNRRFDADFLTVTQLVKSGALGRIVEYESHIDRHRPEQPAASESVWKNKVMPGGSAIYDLGAHILDQAVHLFGLPNRVTAFIGSQREVNTTGYEDAFTVLFHYNSGLVATIKATVVSPEAEQFRFWVRGDKGSYKKFHFDIQEEQLRGGIKATDSVYGREPRERYGTLSTIQNGKPVKEVYPTVEGTTWAEYYRRLAQALAGEGELPASGEEAREVIRLIELAKESSRLGKTLEV